MKYSKKISTFAAALTISVSLLGTTVKADDHYALGSVYVKPEVGYALPTDNDVDSTVFLGAKVGYDIDSNWAAELETGWMRFGIDDEGAKDLDINTTPVLANIRYGQRCDHDQVGWYTYAGVGWASNHLDSNDLGVSLQDATIWQVGLGAEIPVSDDVDGFVDVRYLANSSNIYTPAQIDAGDVDLNAVIFAAGVKF